jgi:hypothetical protein
MKTLEQLLEELADRGDRFAFSLEDGSYYEGYILQTAKDALEFGIGGPLAPEEPITIHYSDLDFGSIRFYDRHDRKYKDAKLSEARDRWIIH